MARVLITGATGGFGREFARQLEALDYDLILHGRHAGKLEELRNTLAQPARHTTAVAPLGSDQGVAGLLAELHGESIHGLVNNAGFGLWGKFEERGLEEQLHMLHTDLATPVELTHALLPQLIEQRGFIINVSSLAGEYPLPFMSCYAAAKAGLSYWSEALRIELANRVRVVTLAPGPSPTGFRDVSGMAQGTGDFFRTPPAKVIALGLKTLQAGGGYCVPGWRHRLLWAMQKSVPRFLGLHIMARQLGAGSPSTHRE